MFAYTPYDGSRQPFTIGLEALDPDSWIEPDGEFASQMAEKDRIFAAHGGQVLQSESETKEAQAELLDLLLDYLPRQHPDFFNYDPASGEVTLAITGSRYRIADWADAPLALAARLVQDDICLMHKGEGGYRLLAAALCFPSSWILAEKFGRPMSEIHESVPGFAGQMAARVDRIFDRLQPDKPVWRMNWSVYTSPALYQPASHNEQFSTVKDCDDPARLFIRVERQTLRRLPVSGDIVFTIKVYHDPLATLAGHPRKAELVTGICHQLRAMNGDQIHYRGLAGQRDALIGLLKIL